MKIYGTAYQNIPNKELPAVGEIYVCLDPQHRLGKRTWVVAEMGDGTLKGDTIQLGLFWEKGDALGFAKLKEDGDQIDIDIDLRKGFLM